MALNCGLSRLSAAVVVMSSLWLSAAICAAEEGDSTELAPAENALVNCPGQENYEWCFQFLSDCESWIRQSPQQDSCQGGGFVSQICGGGNNYASFTCP